VHAPVAGTGRRLALMAISVPHSVEQALSEAGIRFAYLFGSRASGTATQQSDADVAVMPGGELGLLEQAGLAAQLATALDVAHADVVPLNRATLELCGRIVQEGRLIYSVDEPARVAFEVRTLSEYFDFLPTLRQLERSYLAHVAKHGL
jgi:predicted nucleotidyltransferase